VSATEPGSESAAAAPVIVIEGGNPSPEDVAIVAAVLSAMGGSDAPAERSASDWNAPSVLLRAPVGARRGGWQASGRPL